MSKSNIFSDALGVTGYENTKPFREGLWPTSYPESPNLAQTFSRPLMSHSLKMAPITWSPDVSPLPRLYGSPPRTGLGPALASGFILCSVHHAARDSASSMLASRTAPCIDYPRFPQLLLLRGTSSA